MAMREIVRLPVVDCLPTAADVLAGQGVPADRETPEPIAESLCEARDLFRELAIPISVVFDITKEEFAAVYHGEGKNAPESPLAGIFPKAEQLVLFAVTIGEKVGEEISRLERTLQTSGNDFSAQQTLDLRVQHVPKERLGQGHPLLDPLLLPLH